MSLYSIEIKNGSEKQFFSLLNQNGFEIISSMTQNKNSENGSFRFEIMSPQKSKINPRDVLLSQIEEKDFTIKEHQGIFEKNAIEINLSEDINNSRILEYTSNRVIHSIRNDRLNTLEKIRAVPFIKNRMGLISDGRAYDLNESTLLDLKRDAVVLAKFSGINGVPLMIKSKNEDEFIRNAISMAENFFALRISGIQKSFDSEEFARISSNVSIPVIFSDTMERAPTIAAVVNNALRRIKKDIYGKKAAIIGLSSLAEMLANLLLGIGAEKIYGIDSDPKLLSTFERGKGIVATIDQAYDNADILIIMPGVKTALDEKRLNDEQIIISFATGCVNKGNLSPAILKNSYFGYEPNPFYTLPGIASFVQKTGFTEFNIDFAARVMKSLIIQNTEGGLLPRPNMVFIKKQSEMLA